MQAHQLDAFLAPYSDATVSEKQAVRGPLKTEDSVGKVAFRTLFDKDSVCLLQSWTAFKYI